MNQPATLTITFEGRTVHARPGQTIAGALYAAGIRIFSRSFKYHRPRGLFCVAGRCPNCLMNVNGEPNVRTCTTPVAEGQVIRSQNAYPSLDFDVLSAVEAFDTFLPVGFYYKTMIRPRSMWPVYETVLRHIAGLGEIDIGTVPDHPYEKEYRHADVVVIGGGPAGMSAALAAARAGAEVALVDDQPALGGRLRGMKMYGGMGVWGYGRMAGAESGEKGKRGKGEKEVEGWRDGGESEGQERVEGWKGGGENLRTTGAEVAEALAAEVAAEGRIEAFVNATAFGYYEDDLIGVIQGARTIQIRTRRAVIATGRFEHPLVFRNNDLPGVMLGSGVRRLMRLDRVVPGRRALVVTTNDYGLEVAADLVQAGVTVEAVADARPTMPYTQALQILNLHDVPMFASHTIAEACGDHRVTGAVIVQIDAQGHVVPETEKHVGCDLIALSTGFEPASGLISQSGGRMRYDEASGAFVIDSLPPSVMAAGDVAGTHHLEAQLIEGEHAGLRSAVDLGFGDEDAVAQCERRRTQLDERKQQPEHAPNLISIPHRDKKKFVCLCEDLTEKDLCDAIEEGYDHIETLKRYSTLSMGPCQGKMCSVLSVHLCARATGRTVAETGTTTSRPPIQPVSFGALSGHIEEPVKRTPLHHTHVALDAEQMVMGSWMRPRIYTSMIEEYRAVRERVGLIDVGTLGKLDVKGKDAAALLDKVYTNRMSSLNPGRVRYGVMCDDSGVIMDDGTVTRLAEDHFFITTTSGNVEFVHEWLEWWTAGAGVDVSVVNVTAGYAAVNIAGPHARDVLSALTDTDLSTDAAPYMAAPRGRIAGIPALMLRIGFVGELGYEIHAPAEYGPALWDALMETGASYGIRPFGVDTQRLLRLEKKHVIIGQDTDALSNPLEADMAWVVHFKKKDFIGKASLRRVQAQGLRQKLIGFVMEQNADVKDGNSVVAVGRSVGRVTSYRYSPAMDRGIGMAWVPAAMGDDGAPLSIHVANGLASARVHNRPFYDPEGTKLKD